MWFSLRLCGFALCGNPLLEMISAGVPAKTLRCKAFRVFGEFRVFSVFRVFSGSNRLTTEYTEHTKHTEQNRWNCVHLLAGFLRALGRRLKQLDRITRWIVEQYLRSARPGRNFIPEIHVRFPQPFDFRRQIVDVDDHPIPTAACFGHCSVFHRFRRSARPKWRAKDKTDAVPSKHCEIRKVRHLHLEAEMFCVEVD